jgi:transcriptional regulator with XRE-family HTH domain
MTLQQRLVEVRTKAQLSQAELARRINKSKSAICEFEKGVREPSLAILRDIATACAVELAELVA